MKNQKNDLSLNVMIVILLIIIVFLIYYAFSLFGKGKVTVIKQYVTPTSAVESSPTPTPYPIAQGKQIYYISGSEIGPNMTETIIDPFDPKISENQTISVKVKDGYKVFSVSAILKSDHNKKQYQLKLKEGNENDGIWEATWKTEDTHDFVYNINLKAANSANEMSEATLTFR